MIAKLGSVVKENKGVSYALSAFFLWGLFPIYFKILYFVQPQEVLVHRIVWSTVFCVILLIVLKKFKSLFDFTLRDFCFLALTAFLLVINWFFYLVAVVTDNIVEASMGLFHLSASRYIAWHCFSQRKTKFTQ